MKWNNELLNFITPEFHLKRWTGNKPKTDHTEAYMVFTKLDMRKHDHFNLNKEHNACLLVLVMAQNISHLNPIPNNSFLKVQCPNSLRKKKKKKKKKRSTA